MQDVGDRALDSLGVKIEYDDDPMLNTDERLSEALNGFGQKLKRLSLRYVHVRECMCMIRLWMDPDLGM